MFGHSEKRDGDLTTGQYNVLLPDGRKQVRNSFNFCTWLVEIANFIQCG